MKHFLLSLIFLLSIASSPAFSALETFVENTAVDHDKELSVKNSTLNRTKPVTLSMTNQMSNQMSGQCDEHLKNQLGGKFKPSSMDCEEMSSCCTQSCAAKIRFEQFNISSTIQQLYSYVSHPYAASLIQGHTSTLDRPPK